MKKIKTKEDIHFHKDTVMTNLSAFLDSLIDSGDKDMKRADLICYWLKDFQQYISQEQDFDAAHIKSYKRGDVVKVNLGFNVGSEQGGLRYAIVLDKSNKHNAKTITIIPLTSIKDEKSINERDISLGRELYSRLKDKHDALRYELDAKKAECNNAIKSFSTDLQTLRSFKQNSTPEIQQIIANLEKLLNMHNDVLKDLNEDEKALQRISTELHRMKDGSIAKIEQITTISKQRIYDPKKSTDVLNGISFSDTAMEKINEKIKELYIF